MAVSSRLQCARQFFMSLLPDLGKPAPLVEDLISKPEAMDMLQDLRMCVRSPEGVIVYGELPPTDDNESGHVADTPDVCFASGSVQVRHMGRVICTLHASSQG